MAVTKEDVVSFIDNMTVLEMSELVKELEEKYGVTAAAPIAMASGAGAEKPAEEEKTEFSVTLVSFGDKKIQVIKVVREITGLGLKEAKDVLEGAPKVIKEGMNKEEAEEIKNKLEKVGAIIEIK